MRRQLTDKKIKPKRGTSPIDEAMRYLGYSARSVREVERRLDACEFGEVEIMEAVQRLEELNLLNDAQYAADFISTRLSAKPVSRAHLREQLLAHELPREIIDEALCAVTDEMERDNARSVAEKYLRQFASLDAETRCERALKRVLSRGFDFDTARAAIEEARAAMMEEETP